MIIRRPKSNVEGIVGGAFAQVGSVRLPLGPLTFSIGFAFFNWMADAACLVFAIKAIGAPVPWHQVLLAWSAGVGAQSLSATPGGIGPVEVTMTAALVAAGLHPSEAVAAVLVYRIINSKLLGSLGLLVGHYVRIGHAELRKSRRASL
jgi:uncharacterized protein (TIRG00374 family)